MSDFTNHGDKPIEFCGDQEGWIAVGSLTSDSSNSPCYPRAILLGVGLGPSGKMHPSNIAAMLTIEQATDLRTRLTEAMAVDRPAPTPTPAPGLDLDAVADTMRGLDNIFAQAMSSRDAEIARLTAELAAARAVTPDVEASRPATVGGLLATAPECPTWCATHDPRDMATAMDGDRRYASPECRDAGRCLTRGPLPKGG